MGIRVQIKALWRDEYLITGTPQDGSDEAARLHDEIGTTLSDHW